LELAAQYGDPSEINSYLCRFLLSSSHHTIESGSEMTEVECGAALRMSAPYFDLELLKSVQN
jgi:hypothetical protein